MSHRYRKSLCGNKTNSCTVKMASSYVISPPIISSPTWEGLMSSMVTLFIFYGFHSYFVYCLWLPWLPIVCFHGYSMDWVCLKLEFWGTIWYKCTVNFYCPISRFVCKSKCLKKVVNSWWIFHISIPNFCKAFLIKKAVQSPISDCRCYLGWAKSVMNPKSACKD